MNSANRLDGFEPVHMVLDYYDGIVSGIADFKGIPHFFQSIFDDSLQEYSDTFRLVPLSAEEFDLGIRHFDMFLEWQTRFQNGKTDLSTHPAKIAEGQPWNEAKRRMEAEIGTNSARVLNATGEMVKLRDGAVFTMKRALQVRWTPQGSRS